VTTWVALLASVNVGSRRVRMPALRELFVDLGADDPETYVQSGNVVFDHDESDAEVLTALVENRLADGCGFPVVVHLRTGSQLAEIVERCPVSEDDPTKLTAVFLAATPSDEAVGRVARLAVAGESLHVDGTTAYLHLPFGTGRSKLAAGTAKLGVPGTGRNWRSVVALRDLALAR
jgi:uncharacterized protein (DUF1697 family)